MIQPNSMRHCAIVRLNADAAQVYWFLPSILFPTNKAVRYLNAHTCDSLHRSLPTPPGGQQSHIICKEATHNPRATTQLTLFIPQVHSMKITQKMYADDEAEPNLILFSQDTPGGKIISLLQVHWTQQYFLRCIFRVPDILKSWRTRSPLRHLGTCSFIEADQRDTFSPKKGINQKWLCPQNLQSALHQWYQPAVSGAPPSLPPPNELSLQECSRIIKGSTFLLMPDPGSVPSRLEKELGPDLRLHPLISLGFDMF